MTVRAIAACLALTVAGCIQPTRPPEVKAETLAEIDAEISKRQSVIRDLETLISMSVEGLENSGSFTGSVHYQPPDKLRMEGIKAGLSVFVFTLVGERFHVHLLTENKLVKGRLGGQEVKHPELVAAFSWLAERPAPGDERELESLGEAEAVIATRRAGVVARRTYIERKTLLTTRVVLYGPDGAENARVEMSDYREVKPPEAFPGPSAWMPEIIRVTGKTSAGANYLLVSKLRQAYLNEGLEEGTFDMTIPEGVTVEEK